MQQLRRSLLSILLLVAVVTAVVGSPGVSSAAPRRYTSEPVAQPPAPTPTNPDPNSGEPDSGSTRSRQAQPNISTASISNPQFALRAARVVGWTSLVWAKRMIGIGF